MSQFNWGIIGTGGIARAFATDIAHLSDHIIAAVGSRNLETAENFVKSIPGAKAYGSYEALINDSDIDAIYVATPHPSHKENVLAALKAKKPVLCEKPFAVNASEAKEMVAAAKANDVALISSMASPAFLLSSKNMYHLSYPWQEQEPKSWRTKCGWPYDQSWYERAVWGWGSVLSLMSAPHDTRASTPART